MAGYFTNQITAANSDAKQIERLVASAIHRHEEQLAAATLANMGSGVCERLDGLRDRDGLLAELRADSGALGLETLFAEIDKLTVVHALEMPEDLSAGTSDWLVAAWRARAACMFPSDCPARPEPVRLTLLAALCWTRQSEITDGLVVLLIRLIQWINVRVERGSRKN